MVTITVNGLDLDVVVAHYQSICLLTSVLSAIADGDDASGEVASRNARKALKLWDKQRTEKPTIKLQVVQTQEARDDSCPNCTSGHVLDGVCSTCGEVGTT